VGALARFAFEASTSAWSLPRAGIKMEYLMDQLSRRPLKVISGVKPLDHDSIVAQSDSAAAKK
jgi:hypothetical protein